MGTTTQIYPSQTGSSVAWTPKLPLTGTRELRELYRSTLFDDVIPWWTRHSPDRECGGFYSCLERDGSPFAGDKYMWMLGREIWMYSHLFNRHKRNPEWLDLAKHGADFLLKHAFLPDGKMNFRLTRQGQPLAKCLSLYTEVFAAIALAELSHATDDRTLWRRAVDMYHRILPRLGQPSDTPLLGYALNAKFHLHSHDIVRINLAGVFHELDPHPSYVNDLSRSVESILTRHWKPDLQALLENVALDGQPMLDLPEGRMVHPGHAIESAWMVMEVALGTSQQIPLPTNGECGTLPVHTGHDGDKSNHLHRGNGEAVVANDAIVQTAIEIILRSLERGWDEKYGGLRYVTTLDQSPSHVLEADHKLWWPHCETLYALLLAWAYSGREDVGRWYQKVHDYTFSHFPDPQHGEWYGYLNRDGSPVFTAKATAWKCFFHLPRALMRCHQLLDRALKTGDAQPLQGPHLRS